MDIKEREKEVMEYLENYIGSHRLNLNLVKDVIDEIVLDVVKMILRRYELYDVEDMPRE